MTFGEFALGAKHPHEHLRDIVKMQAFAARYGHTDPAVTGRMELPRLTMFVQALAELLEDEKRANAPHDD